MFHRYLTNSTPLSTDDEHSSERVINRDSFDSQNTINTKSTAGNADTKIDLSTENSDLCRPCTSTDPLFLDNLNILTNQRETIFVDV